SAGVKLADADLMGMPYRLLVSPKTIANAQVELTERRSKNTELVGREEIVQKLRCIISASFV
ncbi:MAG: His/Gly/Thr/Pro-type tRNA ligase C-terminal domain-containing protein, partial [Firmicutes bacterium]|nr:His/Gly/Thr/Pro-type tRNA ligase C-terminal domain-containing protein [Bacillota bacterium]